MKKITLRPWMRRTLLYLLALGCIVGFVRLGIWQLHRAEYKEELIAKTREILTARQPQPLGVSADQGMPDNEPDAWLWVAGTGKFLPMPAIILDNQVRHGISGIRIYRVFQPDGARHAILVELGWRPLPSREDMPNEPAPPALTQVRGMLSPPPVAGLKLGGSAIQKRPDGSLLIVRLDPDKLAPALKLSGGLAPRVLRLDPTMRVGYKRDLTILSGTLPPEQHRGYAVQWFGMAITLAVVTIVVSLRRKPGKAGKPDKANRGVAA